MCAWFYFQEFFGGYVKRQNAIQVVDKIWQIQQVRFRRVEVCKKIKCMNTCIGTATTQRILRFAEQFGQSGIQNSLHTLCIGLYLPSMILGPFISELKKIALHGFRLI